MGSQRRIRPLASRALGIVLLMVCLAAEAANVQVYNTDASWAAAAGANVVLEDFSDLSTPGLSITFGTIGLVPGCTNLQGGCIENGKYHEALFNHPNNTSIAVLNFAPHVRAFGATWDLTPFGPSSGIAFHVTFADGKTMTVLPQLLPNVPVQFYGIVSDTPIAKIQLSAGNAEDPESFNVDHAKWVAFDPSQITTVAQSINPYGVVVRNGVVYFSDQNTHSVWRIDTNIPSSTPQRIAGLGSTEPDINNGYNGDGRAALTALLSNPIGLALDAAGTSLYIADSGNHAIRKVALTESGPGIITTVAGRPGEYIGPGTLHGPRGVAVDLAGNVYIADTQNQIIQMVNAAVPGVLDLVAGVAGVAGNIDSCSIVEDEGCPADPPPPMFNSPVGIAVDGAGRLYVADEGNHKVRMITEGSVRTMALGNLVNPTAVTVAPGDFATTLYVSDYGQFQVKRVTCNPAGECSLGPFGNSVVVVAGTGTPGVSNEGGPATASPLNSVSGLALDDGGDLFIADRLNERIRRVDFNPPAPPPPPIN